MTTKSFYYLLKRGVDLFVSLALLVLLLPLLIIISLLIKLDGTGGPIFADIPKRVGKNGRTFLLYKFRTMVPGAHEILQEDPRYKDLLKIREQSNGKIPLNKDPRITKIGRLLRMFDLDELPQLINVLKGEMTLVGPRPYYEEEFKIFADKVAHSKNVFAEITSVRPGITGLWQISGRNNLSPIERMKMDVEYVSKESLLLDLWIMLQTPFVIISRKGAL